MLPGPSLLHLGTDCPYFSKLSLLVIQFCAQLDHVPEGALESHWYWPTFKLNRLRDGGAWGDATQVESSKHSCQVRQEEEKFLRGAWGLAVTSVLPYGSPREVLVGDSWWYHFLYPSGKPVDYFIDMSKETGLKKTQLIITRISVCLCFAHQKHVSTSFRWLHHIA